MVGRSASGYQRNAPRKMSTTCTRPIANDRLHTAAAPFWSAPRPGRLRLPALASGHLAGPAARRGNGRLFDRPHARPPWRAGTAVQRHRLHPRPAHPHRRIRAPQRLRIHRPGSMASRRRHRRHHPHRPSRLTRPRASRIPAVSRPGRALQWSCLCSRQPDPALSRVPMALTP